MDTKVCPECNNTFTRHPNECLSMFKKRTYCGILCRNRVNGRKQKPTPRHICQQCGAYLKKVNQSNLCRSCHDALSLNSWWTLGQTAFLKEHYSEHGAKWVASQLGLGFIKVRDKANRIGLVLSPSTYYKTVHLKAQEYMLQHNPMKNPDVVKKVSDTQRITGIRQRNFQKLMAGQQRLRKTSITKPQRKLYQAMQQAGIKFEPEYLIKPKFIVDTAIPKYKIIIQVDGCYWHGHGCRLIPLTKRQKHQQAKDKAQDKYLQTCGWTILRFWECEINNDITACITKVQAILDKE